jgi:REP-associated tyrosine transposase
MKDSQSLSHTKWECKDHVLFSPKYRRKVLSGHLRTHRGEGVREVVRPRESLSEEGHLPPEQGHLVLAIPPT